MVISTIIDGDKSEVLCNLMYLKLLKDAETIKPYAWGSAMLANLIDSFVKFNRKSMSSMLSGFKLALFVSICALA